MPGGWGWTDLSGAVPDADDTPAALLAIASLDLSKPSQSRLQHQSLDAVAKGLRWLISLQNRDGGWPTFCRGWGKLPFDRSGTDLTAHSLRAFQAWLPQLERLRQENARTPRVHEIARAIGRGRRFLARKQRPDGSWLPLWFGNQDHPEEDNPIYGTAKVLLAYVDLDIVNDPEAQRAITYLVENQNADGGWGGGPSVPYQVRTDEFRLTATRRGACAATSAAACTAAGDQTPNRAGDVINSSIEETALALEALIQCGAMNNLRPTVFRGLNWLVFAIENGNLNTSWPIGFYFAKLWYHEKLYPAIFSLSALGSALCASESGEADSPPITPKEPSENQRGGHLQARPIQQE